MIDIIEKLREYAQYAETRSERDTFEATIDEISRLREELASAKQAAAAYEAWKFPEDIQALTVENERLREENARLEASNKKLNADLFKQSELTAVTMTRCADLMPAQSAIVKLKEQQVEIERMREENARLLGENWELVMRAHALLSLLPPETTCGQVQEARAKLAAIREGGKDE